MRVILLERVEKLGDLGDSVVVKSGYARNYLLREGKALRATDENLRRFEAEKAALVKVNDERRKSAEALRDKLLGGSVVIVRSASESGHLYGSVTARDISLAISDAFAITVDKRCVEMRGLSKMLGIFDYRIVLHPEVDVVVKVNIAQSVEEAALQADRVSRGLPALSVGDSGDDEDRGKDGDLSSSEVKAAAAADAALEQAAAEADADIDVADSGLDSESSTDIESTVGDKKVKVKRAKAKSGSKKSVKVAPAESDESANESDSESQAESDGSPSDTDEQD